MAGLETEELAKGLKKLSDQSVKAASGNKEAAALFKAFGVDPGTLDNLKTLDQLILEFADKFAALPEGPIRTAAAIALFGEKGAKLLPVLSQGSAKIKELKEITDLFGFTISGEFATNAAKFNDSLDILGAATEGWKRRIVSAISGPLAAFVGAMVELKKESAETQKALGGFKV